MPILSNAPLIEAIFELRWGKASLDPAGVSFEFAPEDSEYFIGQFYGVAKQRGFAVVERIRPLLGVPHVVTHRFRRTSNTWPCMQIGLGTFVVNQANEGYSWREYRKSILEGLEILNAGHPLGISGLPAIGMELRYQDGFAFEEGEDPVAFIESKLNLRFAPAEAFVRHGGLDAKTTIVRQMAFEIGAIEPPGVMIIELQTARIKERPGFLLETVVRSVDGTAPRLELDAIAAWLDSAHRLQQHAFRTLIDPDFARSFE